VYGGTNDGAYKSTDAGVTWNAASTGLAVSLIVPALAIDPDTPSTLYCGTSVGVYKSTDGGANWNTFGLPSVAVNALTIDSRTPTTLYAATNGGVFDIEQEPPFCVGDCDGDGTVTIDELLALVNSALGDGQASVCPTGIANGATADVPLIVTAVNHALNGCAG